MISFFKYRVNIILLYFFLFQLQSLLAQKSRFTGFYPLATPNETIKQLEYDYYHTKYAIKGGVSILDESDISSKRDDKEAFIINDYREIIGEMVDYAESLANKLKSKSSQKKWAQEISMLMKVKKMIKASKYLQCQESLKENQLEFKENSKSAFWIWKEYIDDKKHNVKWLDPNNIKVTKVYKRLLDHVKKNYERPFGAYAEDGAILADAAQSLSNCMENPSNISWLGDGKITLEEGDELKRLSNNVSYYEWKLNIHINAMRSAQINMELVRCVKKALYCVIESILNKKENWGDDPVHGENLLLLYNAAKSKGWYVDGDKSNKKK